MNDHDPAGIDPPTTASTGLPGALDEAEADRARRAVDEDFSAFYRADIRALTGFLLHHGAVLPVAADIAQESMIQAHRYWSGLDSPRAWVRTVAARMLARRTAAIREDPVDEIPEPTSLLPRPDAYAEFEARYDVLAVLRSLPPRQRQILAWTLDGYTPADIAAQLGITPEAVRASLMKARRAAVQYLSIREEEL